MRIGRFPAASSGVSEVKADGQSEAAERFAQLSPVTETSEVVRSHRDWGDVASWFVRGRAFVPLEHMSLVANC